MAEQIRESAGSEFQVAETYGYFGGADKAFYWPDLAVQRQIPAFSGCAATRYGKVLCTIRAMQMVPG